MEKKSSTANANPSSSSLAPPRGRYQRICRGVRKNKWGQYVSRVSLPKNSQLYLGSYNTVEKAVRAHDAAQFCLHGHHGKFIFPNDIRSIDAFLRTYNANFNIDVGRQSLTPKDTKNIVDFARGYAASSISTICAPEPSQLEVDTLPLSNGAGSDDQPSNAKEDPMKRLVNVKNRQDSLIERKTAANELKYRGVAKHKCGKYESRIRIQPNSRKRLYIGLFDTGEKAACAFDAALFCLRGRKGNFNFPNEIHNFDVGRQSLTPKDTKEIVEFAKRYEKSSITSCGNPSPSPALEDDTSPSSNAEFDSIDVSFLDMSNEMGNNLDHETGDMFMPLTTESLTLSPNSSPLFKESTYAGDNDQSSNAEEDPIEIENLVSPNNSPLVKESTNSGDDQASNAKEDPIKRLINVLKSMSPTALIACSRDFQSIITNDGISGNIQHCKPTKDGNDLADGEKTQTRELLKEMKEINQEFIEVVVDVMNVNYEGTLIKVSYYPTRLGDYEKAKDSPDMADYPNSSPVMVETLPPDLSRDEEEKDRWMKAKSNFSLFLRTLPELVSLNEKYNLTKE